MNGYTCIKRATFAGVDYMPGDIVPVGAIPAGRVGAVIRLGFIAEAQTEGQAEEPAAAAFDVPIILSDGTVERLEVTPATVEEAVAVLQMTADGAAEHIGKMTTPADAAALALIGACDGRKTVKKAAQAQAQAIEEATQTAQDGQKTAGGTDTQAGTEDAQKAAQAAQGAAE